VLAWGTAGIVAAFDCLPSGCSPFEIGALLLFAPIRMQGIPHPRQKFQ
jgi:hypothetical protein